MRQPRDPAQPVLVIDPPPSADSLSCGPCELNGMGEGRDQQGLMRWEVRALLQRRDEE